MCQSYSDVSTAPSGTRRKVWQRLWDAAFDPCVPHAYIISYIFTYWEIYRFKTSSRRCENLRYVPRTLDHRFVSIKSSWVTTWNWTKLFLFFLFPCVFVFCLFVNSFWLLIFTPGTAEQYLRHESMRRVLFDSAAWRTKFCAWRCDSSSWECYPLETVLLSLVYRPTKIFLLQYWTHVLAFLRPIQKSFTTEWVYLRFGPQSKQQWSDSRFAKCLRDASSLQYSAKTLVSFAFHRTGLPKHQKIAQQETFRITKTIGPGISTSNLNVIPVCDLVVLVVDLTM